MDSHQDNEMERGPILTPQILILILFLIGVPALSLLFSRKVVQDEPSLWGKYKGDSSSSQPADEELPNRKEEVDAAVADVDFEKFDYQIKLDTTLGTILLDLWPDVAPGHCKNMIGLSRIGFYDGVIFHRVIAGFMAQGGDPLGSGLGGPGYMIDAEFNNRQHLPGVLSMARSGSPNSAGSQFFICTAPRSDLDGSYTAFGKTADQESLDVVMKFDQVKTGQGDRPLEDIVIKSAEVIVKPKSGT